LTVTLKEIANDGQLLEATFLPSKGMNLISYKKGGVEVIDPSTSALFTERFAGLGALIGPHFHHRKEIPPVPFEERFPHVARLKAKGVKEPFSHGIGRYAPWNYTSTNTSLHAHISGNDTWEGVLLSHLEGFNFAMYMDVELRKEGLFIEMSVSADKPSVIGSHYYYAIGKGSPFLRADVKGQYFDGKGMVNAPSSWQKKDLLQIPLDGSLDYGFYPQDKELYTEVLLQADTHKVRVKYLSNTEEGSLQIYHPEGSSFVCIEPLSATFPREPHLNASGVNIQIEIL